LSSSSEQNSPKIQNNKKLFFTSNRYEVLSQDEPVSATTSNTIQPDSPVQYTEETLNVGIKPTLPPPIFVRGVINFTDLCAILIELIGVNNFYCKSSTDRLKIMTNNPNSYKMLIYFLKDQKAEYHTYQKRV
jgi:hypothetical protein